MASGRRHWRAVLERLDGRTDLTRAERRQLRKQLGRAHRREWRIFGFQTRTWRFEVSQANPGAVELLRGFANGPRAYVAGGRFVPIQPTRELPVDGLSILIAQRTKRLGHVIGRRETAA